MNPTAIKAIAQSIRSLSMDAVQKANSGHPGLPLGCAEIGAVLYSEFLKLNPKKTDWINRDRFVLSAGHGSIWLYSLLHMAGFDVSLEDIKNFRQVGSKTPGHPEYGYTDGVETTTGPLGQGFANAVGMALAAEYMANTFNTDKHQIFDHYVYTLTGDGCLMEGISSEAASLAGHLGLGRLIAIYDSNNISIEGSTDLAFTEDVAKRFESQGWHVVAGDGHNPEDIRNLIEEAKKETSKPSLVVLKTIIGYGSPAKAGSASSHGAPLGVDEVTLTKKALGLDPEKSFEIQKEAQDRFKAVQDSWAKGYQEWEALYSEWASANPEKKKQLDAFLSGEFDLSQVKWPEYKEGDSVATRKASGASIAAFTDAFLNIIGGSADLGPSNNSVIPSSGSFTKEDRGGRNIHFGVREHAMGAMANGIALYGGLRTYTATFLVFADYMRPSIRLAALMKLPVTFVFTHDSIYVGEDGPTHQPIEHLASLRMIPGLHVLRPGDAEESIEAWKMALGYTDAPTVLAFSRQNLTVYPKPEGWKEGYAKGAYVVKDSQGAPEITLVATGSEVNVALDAAAKTDKKVRVVSVSSVETFLKSDKAYLETVVPSKSKVIAVEAGVGFGWHRVADETFTIDRFGESGPGAKVAEHLGFTAEELSKKL